MSGSQKDLISVTVSDAPSAVIDNNNMEKLFKVNNGKERHLMGALFVSLLGKDPKSRVP